MNEQKTTQGKSIRASSGETNLIYFGFALLVTMLVAVAIGGLIYSQISQQLGDQVEDNSIGENVKEETDDGANTVFPLLVLVVIVGVFVALIGVLRQM